MSWRRTSSTRWERETMSVNCIAQALHHLLQLHSLPAQALLFHALQLGYPLDLLARFVVHRVQLMHQVAQLALRRRRSGRSGRQAGGSGLAAPRYWRSIGRGAFAVRRAGVDQFADLRAQIADRLHRLLDLLRPARAICCLSRPSSIWRTCMRLRDVLGVALLQPSATGPPGPRCSCRGLPAIAGGPATRAIGGASRPSVVASGKPSYRRGAGPLRRA